MNICENNDINKGIQACAYNIYICYKEKRNTICTGKHRYLQAYVQYLQAIYTRVFKYVILVYIYIYIANDTCYVYIYFFLNASRAKSSLIPFTFVEFIYFFHCGVGVDFFYDKLSYARVCGEIYRGCSLVR